MPRSLVLLSILYLAGCHGDADPGASSIRGGEGLTVIEGWPDPAVASETMLPWTLEAMADVVASGEAGEPLERDGRDLLTLRLEEILFGDALVGEVFPDDDAPFLGCIPPETIPRPSETFPPGSELLIYLQRRDGRLSILYLGERPASLDGVREVLALKVSLHEPEPDWKILLALGTPRRERQLYTLLTVSPPAGAGPALAATFQSSMDRLEGPDPAARPDLELVLQRAHLLRFQPAPECLDALGRLVDWLLDQDRLARVADCLPMAPGLVGASAEQKQGWLLRTDRLAQHESLQRQSQQLRRLLTR